MRRIDVVELSCWVTIVCCDVSDLEGMIVVELMD